MKEPARIQAIRRARNGAWGERRSEMGIWSTQAQSPAAIPMQEPEITHRGKTRLPDQRSENPTVRPPMKPPNMTTGMVRKPSISLCRERRRSQRGDSPRKQARHAPDQRHMDRVLVKTHMVRDVKVGCELSYQNWETVVFLKNEPNHDTRGSSFGKNGYRVRFAKIGS